MNASLPEAAAFLAAHYPVFPCDAEKRPCTERGFHDATRDEGEARALFARRGAALIGTPTGSASGLLVVDVDTRDGGAGFRWLADNETRMPRTRRHRTRSGGLHLVFRYPTGCGIPCSQGRVTKDGELRGVALGVDVRGRGGYAIVPPSAGYSILDDAEPAEMPAWLVEACNPSALERCAPPHNADATRRDGGNGQWAAAALARECEAIQRAGFGSQEKTLNDAAFNIGQVVAGGHLSDAEAFAALSAAALAMASQPGKAPWVASHLERKIRRGLVHGADKPRDPLPRPRASADTASTRRADRQEAPPMPDGYTSNGAASGADPHGFHQHAEGAAWTREEAPPPGPPPFRIEWFADVEPVLESREIVQGLLDAQAGGVVYGASNAGKSFLTMDIALHIAAGLPWNGRRVEQGGVLYLALEGGTGVRNRIVAWKRERGLDGAHLPFALVACPINLLDPEADAPRLVETVKLAAEQSGFPFVLVVVDTLARAFAGGNENASEDMGALVRNMDAIRAATGAAVLFIHHSGKNEAMGARGHSSLRAAIDTEIEVKADDETGARTATVVKQREKPKGDVFPFALRVVELGRNQHGEPVTSCAVEPDAPDMSGPVRARKLSGDQRMAFEVLTDASAEIGAPGFPGTPADTPSVPEDWWRDRFYSRAKPGASPETKQKAFRRAADALTEKHLVATNKGRVWVV